MRKGGRFKAADDKLLGRGKKGAAYLATKLGDDEYRDIILYPYNGRNEPLSEGLTGQELLEALKSSVPDESVDAFFAVKRFTQMKPFTDEYDMLMKVVHHIDIKHNSWARMNGRKAGSEKPSTHMAIPDTSKTGGTFAFYNPDANIYLILNERGSDTLSQKIETGGRESIDLPKLFCDMIHTLYVLNFPDPPVIHADVKPDNIMWFEASKRYKLIDWESAMEMDENKKKEIANRKGGVKFTSNAFLPMFQSFYGSMLDKAVKAWWLIDMRAGKYVAKHYAENLIVFSNADGGASDRQRDYERDIYAAMISRSNLTMHRMVKEKISQRHVSQKDFFRSFRYGLDMHALAFLCMPIAKAQASHGHILQECMRMAMLASVVRDELEGKRFRRTKTEETFSYASFFRVEESGGSGAIVARESFQNPLKPDEIKERICYNKSAVRVGGRGGRGGRRRSMKA